MPCEYHFEEDNFLCNWLKEKLVKDQTVDFETFVETSYTYESYDFNFAVLDSQNLFLVNEVTV